MSVIFHTANRIPPAFFLVGPTASGKTSVAHLLAQKHGWPVLAADSMTVYKGMDAGTAKAPPSERAGMDYYGIDLATPDQPFSVGIFLNAVREEFAVRPSAAPAVLVTGGTGLYVKCLTEGLADVPPAHPARRKEAEALFNERGLAALQEAVRHLDDAAYVRLDDPQNPRRLIRAYELLALGHPLPASWQSPRPPIIGLRYPMPQLRERITRRVRHMYATGLLEEAAALRMHYPVLSHTARHAIGYAEAFAVLDGEYPLEEAIQKTAVRTAQYAKRQMTWFRNQANVRWVDMEQMPSTAAAANCVENMLHSLTPIPLKLEKEEST